MLAISRARVYQLLAAGELPSLKLGKSRRILVDALQAYVARLATERSGGAPS